MAIMQGIEQRRDRDKARRNQEDRRRPGDSEHWEILQWIRDLHPQGDEEQGNEKSRMLIILAITSRLYWKVEIATPAIKAPISADRPSPLAIPATAKHQPSDATKMISGNFATARKSAGRA